jgi:hypothetical protein
LIALLFRCSIQQYLVDTVEVRHTRLDVDVVSVSRQTPHHDCRRCSDESYADFECDESLRAQSS